MTGLPRRTCVVEWERSAHILTVLVTFLAPAFLLLTTALAVLLLYVTTAVRAGAGAGAEAHDSASRSVEPEAAAPAQTADNSQEEPAAWERHHHYDSAAGRVTHGRTRRRRRRRRRRQFSGLQEPGSRAKRECVVAVCVSSFLSVGLQFPLFALLLLQRFCRIPLPAAVPGSSPSGASPAAGGTALATVLPPAEAGLPELAEWWEPGGCHFSDTAWAAGMMLAMAKPGLLPLVWLLYSDVRAALTLRACPLRRGSVSRARRERGRAAASEREEVPGPESACASLRDSLGASQATVM